MQGTWTALLQKLQLPAAEGLFAIALLENTKRSCRLPPVFLYPELCGPSPTWVSDDEREPVLHLQPLVSTRRTGVGAAPAAEQGETSPEELG